MTCFLPILVELCDQHNASDKGWQIPTRADRAGMWLMFRQTSARPPAQGWKLHISAGVPFAEEVLRRALPVLLADNANIKVAASRQKLTRLNGGFAGDSQVGKFITVYPNDDAQAVRLALALDEATRGLRGPAIPSDRPLSRGSLVHYRYGGFDQQYVQLPGSSPLPAITTPEGEKIYDERSTHFQPPTWASDPFVQAGIVQELPAPNPLVGNRYLVMGTLYESARGNVSWARDIPNKRRVVLKRAVRDGNIEPDGRDARDRLRHEYTVLQKLAPLGTAGGTERTPFRSSAGNGNATASVPYAYELIEQDDDVYLAMQDISGATFQKHVLSIYRGGNTVGGEQVVAWGRELAAMLDAIHHQGFIHSGLKSTNLIVAPDGRLRLLDFNYTHDLASENPFKPGATRGYRSPQLAAGAPQAIADDVYALGALLYFAATGAEPALAVRPDTLLDRPLQLVNPAIGDALADIIARCLDPDAGARFASMKDLDAALAAMSSNAIAIPPALGSPDQIPNTNREHYLDLARMLGERLVQDVQKLMGDPEANPARDLYTGSAGTLLALAELASVFNEPAYCAPMAELAHWLANAPRLSAPWLGDKPLAGLYIGEAGIALALWRAGRVLGDANLIALATERGRWIVTLPQDCPELINGAAGRILFHLQLWHETCFVASFSLRRQTLCSCCCDFNRPDGISTRDHNDCKRG